MNIPNNLKEAFTNFLVLTFTRRLMCNCIAMDCVHKLVLRIIAKKEQRAAAIANGADPATMPIRRYVKITFLCLYIPSIH